MFGIGSHMPIRHTFWYSASDYMEHRYRCMSVFLDPEDQAVDAAEDYYSNHDGWEAKWPLTFTIYESEEGPEVAAFDVEMEAVPQFTVSRRDSQREAS